MVSQVRRKQDMEVIMRQCALLRHKPDMLEYYVPLEIGHALLFYAVATLSTGIDEAERRYTVNQPPHCIQHRVFPRRSTSRW